MLFRNKSAKCSTPAGPISLKESFSVMSVCVKKWRCVYETDEERMRLTMLFRNASTERSAPLSPIRLPEISSVVSVCVKREDVYMR
jgi:hypothetical protein